MRSKSSAGTELVLKTLMKKELPVLVFFCCPFVPSKCFLYSFVEKETQCIFRGTQLLQDPKLAHLIYMGT